MRFYRNQRIEELAERRLGELAARLGEPLPVPIPIDLVGEQVLGLDFLWEPIEELPGEVILAGLRAPDRLIVLNERRRGLFAEKPGLERFTKGHEMGHWDLYVDRATLDYPMLFRTGEEARVVYRSSPAGEVAVLKRLLADPEGRELLRRIQARADGGDEARCVNRYAAALLMPGDRLREAVARDRTHWRNLYPLAKQFEVTISAFKVRLEQLDLLHVTRDGELYACKDDANGQRRMF